MSEGALVLSRLDDPWKMGAWEIDVVLPVILCLFVAMLKGTGTALLLGAVVGFFISMKIAKLKAAQHPGYVLHFIYWHLPAFGAINNFSVVPGSAYREMVG